MLCQPDLRLPILEGSASRFYKSGQAGSRELGWEQLARIGKARRLGAELGSEYQKKSFLAGILIVCGQFSLVGGRAFCEKVRI